MKINSNASTGIATWSHATVPASAGVTGGVCLEAGRRVDDYIGTARQTAQVKLPSFVAGFRRDMGARPWSPLIT